MVEPLEHKTRRFGWLALTAVSGLLLALFLIFSGWTGSTDDAQFRFNELHVKSVTSDEGGEKDPAISNDGKQIVFAKVGQSGQSDLWLIDTKTLVSRQLTNDRYFESNPVFSSDGRKIAYLQHGVDECSVILFTLSDGENHRLAECFPYRFGLDWSNDESEMVFLSVIDTGSVITRLDINSGKTTIVTNNPVQGSIDQRPKYSNNGQWINFVRGTNARRELYRATLATGQLTALTDDGRFVSDHAWIGDDVVFSSDRIGSRRLWYLNAKSGQISSVGMPGTNLLSSSKDGRKLVFESAHYTANIYSLQLDRETPIAEKIITSNAYDNYPSLSPDGQMLAHNSNRSGVDSIWLAGQNGEQPHMILQQAGSRMIDASWSADGNSLFTIVYAREKGQILEFTPQGNQIRLFENAGENVYGPRAAGQWIYFIDRGNESPVLARMSSNGIDHPQLLGVTANRVLPGVNGIVYYTKPARDGIFALDTSSGEESLVIADLLENRWKDWALEYPWLVHVGNDENGQRVVIRTNLDSQEREVVTAFSPNTVGGSVDISADGNTLFIARTDRADLDIKMIDLSEN